MNKKIFKDSFQNALTNIGIRGRDKTLYNTIIHNTFTERELAQFYVGCSIYRKIIDAPVFEMTRAGFQIFYDEKDETKNFESFMKFHDLDKKIEQHFITARNYGVSYLVFSFKSQIENNDPIDDEKDLSIDWVQHFDKSLISYSSEIENDPNSKNYRLPKFYNLLNYIKDQKEIYSIHSSRIFKSEGICVPYELKSIYNYGGAPIVAGFYDELMAYLASHKQAFYLMQSTGEKSIIIKNLYEFLAMDAESGGTAGTEALKARMTALEYSASAINGYVMGEDEEIKRMMVDFNGIPEILNKTKEALCSATEIPHTILFNESASGLGATGKSENLMWLQSIKRMQESEYRPLLNYLSKIFFTGFDTSKIKIVFNDLSIPSQNEIEDVRTKRLNNALNLFDRGLMSEEEIEEYLAKGDDVFSLPISILPKSDKDFEIE